MAICYFDTDLTQRYPLRGYDAVHLATALILNPFLEGMREAGAGVELFYTRKLDIKPCTGEFN